MNKQIKNKKMQHICTGNWKKIILKTSNILNPSERATFLVRMESFNECCLFKGKWTFSGRPLIRFHLFCFFKSKHHECVSPLFHNSWDILTKKKKKKEMSACMIFETAKMTLMPGQFVIYQSETFDLVLKHGRHFITIFTNYIHCLRG